MANIPVALALYTVRDETERDFAGVLRSVARMGYAGVEFAGYGQLSSAEMRGLLDETGLRAASTHVSLDRLEGDLDREIAFCKALGSSCLVLPSLPQERRGADDLRALAPRLDEFGRRCRDQGVTFGYHNHDWEFAQHEGSYLLDILLDGTDAALVALELDVYWAAFAGVDPAAYLRRRADRVRLVHLKDLAADRSFAEVGDGTLDFTSIFAAAEQGSALWYIVEHDKPTVPSLQSAQRSLENLRGMGKV